MELNGDPFILLSRVNTMLRDTYSSLDALCEDQDVDRGALEKKLESLGYTYSPEQNRFL